ncbi:MAG: nodulation protein NfeD, partial [Deltaproteobacteria bacterium]|nr:nodulation protein NfeD [Deltaproteobacteria bacterium]
MSCSGIGLVQGTVRLNTAYFLALSICIIITFNGSGIILASDVSTEVILFEVKGAISPAINDYLAKGFEKARNDDADLIILQMDTPGGLDTSMRDIIKNILASPIPVVTYVAPEGARAASAGTYILYASHVAVMSPATNLGAATPISIGGMPGSSDPPDEKQDKEGEQLPTNDAATLKRKVINDASAYIRSLAERHGRNAEWAEEAVR